jgi:hypothetical protein
LPLKKNAQWYLNLGCHHVLIELSMTKGPAVVRVQKCFGQLLSCRNYVREVAFEIELLVGVLLGLVDDPNFSRVSHVSHVELISGTLGSRSAWPMVHCSNSKTACHNHV